LGWETGLVEKTLAVSYSKTRANGRGLHREAIVSRKLLIFCFFHVVSNGTKNFESLEKSTRIGIRSSAPN